MKTGWEKEGGTFKNVPYYEAHLTLYQQRNPKSGEWRQRRKTTRTL